MIRVILEVLKDLWDFICHEVRSFFQQTQRENHVEVINSQQPEKLPNVIARPIIISQNKSGDLVGWSAYVKVDIAPCFSQPEQSVDTKLGSFLYGDKVMVVRTINNFVEVRTATMCGWLDEKDLTDDFNKVLPNFKNATIYGSGDEEVIKLRRLIQDEVLGQYLNLPLQSLEFALSVLKIKQTHVPWPAIRPRLPGSWKNILRGIKGVSMSLEPHTGAILEYAGDDGVSGFFGYVEAVRPDQSITLLSVGRVEEGEYRSEECSRDVWKEWRPVFISFS